MKSNWTISSWALAGLLPAMLMVTPAVAEDCEKVPFSVSGTATSDIVRSVPGTPLLYRVCRSGGGTLNVAIKDNGGTTAATEALTADRACIDILAAGLTVSGSAQGWYCKIRR